MNSRSRTLLLTALFLAVAVTLVLLVKVGADSHAGADSMARAASETAGAISDRPLASFRADLLDLAFKTATALPIQPHIKDRSRAQELVVETCFHLDQPRRALEYIEKIDNWRRGAGYADFAYYCANHGQAGEVQHYIDLAREFIEKPADENSQDWQRDRIRATIAGTYLCLGQPAQAAQFEAGLADSEVGRVAAAKAALLGAESVDEQLKSVDGIVAAGNFNQVRNALESCAQLFNRFYDEKDRRTHVEEKIKTSWTHVPVIARIELMLELAGFALNREDQGKALELVNEAKHMIEGVTLTAEYGLPLMARLAEARYRAGDKEKARSEAEEALVTFDAERSKIVNIYRGKALRPLAEAYQMMGDTAAALRVYKKAVEEGIENPNSRPRAEDLTATCCSMALHGVEPDAELRARMIRIHDALGAPW